MLRPENAQLDVLGMDLCEDMGKRVATLAKIITMMEGMTAIMKTMGCDPMAMCQKMMAKKHETSCRTSPES